MRRSVTTRDSRESRESEARIAQRRSCMYEAHPVPHRLVAPQLFVMALERFLVLAVL